MKPSEFIHRLKLSIRKRLESKARYSSRLSAAANAETALFMDALELPPKKALSRHFDRHFFFGPSQKDTLSKNINEQLPESAENTVALADAILNDSITILGQKNRLIPGDIDWEADPKRQLRAWPSHRIDEDHAIHVTDADVKFVWELNRHQFLPTLARAFWLTNDSRYAAHAVALIDDWLANNRFPGGVNWSSHLEVAMRAISWLWTMPFLLAWEDLDEGFLQRWLAGIVQHHYHLSNNLSVFTDPTNHLIGEVTALWMLSTCLPDLPGAKKRAAQAREVLEEQLECQVTSDGVNKEQASSYHRFVLDFYIQVYALSLRNGNPLPPHGEERIRKMCDYAAALAGEHCRAPMTGDSDDARGIPLQELIGWKFCDVLSTGAVLFNNPEWKRKAGSLEQVTVWLTGINAFETYEALTDTRQACMPGILYKGGYCFIPDLSCENDVELIFDTAPLGLWPNAAHGHADALNVLLRVNGHFLLCDPGTGTYFEDPLIRSQLRSTTAHNSVTIDGLDQADIFDTFKWINPMKVELIESHFEDDFRFATGMHDGYSRLKYPVIHFRSVFSVCAGEWIIIDRFEGKGQHRFTRHFHFPPEMLLQRTSTGEVMAAQNDNGARLYLEFPETDDDGLATIEIVRDGLWSESYGQWSPAPCLKADTRGRPPLTLFTFIKLSNSCGERYVRTSKIQQATICKRVKEDHGELFQEIFMVNPRRQDVQLPGELRSNASFAFVRQSARDSVERAFLAGSGCYVLGPEFHLICGDNKQFAAYTPRAYKAEIDSEKRYE